MELIDKKELNQLLNYSSDVCISIFISTNRAGKEVLEDKDRSKLKGKWEECKKSLEEKGISSDRIAKMEKPIQRLIDDSEFWRHQSDGLAIFAAEDFFKKFTLPIRFEDHVYVASDFYLRSLAPALSTSNKFFILALQLKEVKLYEATEFSLSELKIADLIPANINDQVGYDFEEKHLQMRSQQEGGGNAIFHGHGASTKDHKNEIFQFFNAIDQGLKPILKDENVPLVVFCQDYLFPIYKEANSYSNLFESPVAGNPNDVDLLGLHERTVKTVELYLENEKVEKIENYKEASSAEKSDTIHDIVSFAFEGKIDTLFLKNREEVWGSFDEKSTKVEVHDKKSENSVSLMNVAAKKVMEKGGTVYLIDSVFMPDKTTKMKALLRYS